MLTWELAKQVMVQITAALYAAQFHRRPFSVYIAANYGTPEARVFGIGKDNREK